MTDEHDPTGMRHLLAGLKESGPMPEDLNERIRAGLAQEQVARAAADPADSSATGDPALDDPAPEDPAPDEAVFWSDADADSARPPRRRGANRWMLAVAAAAVIVTGVGGAFALRGGDDAADSADPAKGSPTQAATSAEPRDSEAAEGSDDDGIPVFVVAASETDYTRSGLAREAAGLLADPESAPKNPDDSDLGTMSTAAGAGDCLARLGHPELQPVVLDVAHFEGTPGVLIIAESLPSGPAQAWAVSTGCEPIWPGPTEVSQD